MNNELEIDLRKLVRTALRGWIWIVGAMLIAAVGTTVAILATSRTYKATAAVAVTLPRYLANFDPRYQTIVTANVANKNISDLADSDQIIQEVFSQWSDPRKGTMSLDDFRKRVATTTADVTQGYITLTVETKDAQESARLANLWAGLLAKQANLIYGSQDETQVTFFTDQLKIADQHTKDTDQALVEFSSRNDASILGATLTSLVSTEQDALQKQRAILMAQQDAQTLLKQVSSLPLDAKVDPSELVNWTVIRARFYSVDYAAQTNNSSNTSAQPQAQQVSPVQLQIPLTNTDIITVADYKTSVQAWIGALNDQMKTNQDSVKGLQDQISVLQAKLTALDNEQTRLKLAHDLAVDTYTTLAHKVDEVKISNQAQTGDIRVASQAVAPNVAESKHTVQYVGLATLGAGVLAIIVILLLNWWKTSAD